MNDVLDLFDRGYTDLVCVVPPDAAISEKSTIREENRGKVPGLKGRHGWYGYNFVGQDPPTRETVDRWWAYWGSNIGLLARNFPAIDIDVQSPALRDLVMQLAAQRFGAMPVRFSRSPRALLLFRTSEPFARMALVATHNGKSHLIEVLAGDRQYLIAGQHPSGKPYRWDRELPPPAELPELTQPTALAFLQELGDFLRLKGLEVELIGTGELREVNAPPQESLMAPSIEALRELVAELPNDHHVAPSWDDWIMVGHAIKAASGEDPEGEAIFLEWTARCERVAPADDEEASAQYGRMRAPHRVGWSWLQELAERHGSYSTAQDDFRGLVDPQATVQDAPAAPEALPEALHDEGVVKWLLPRVRDTLRFAPASKLWYVWEEYRWVRDELMRAERVVRGHLGHLCQLLTERGLQAAGKEGEPYLKAATALQGARRIEGLIKLLRAHLALKPDAFDRDPWLLNTPGGVVNLRTGEITKGKPSDMHSRSTGVAPAPGKAPRWERFLRDATGGDRELQEYLRRLLGYTLTGDMSEKVLWYVWGSESDTGKSTMLRTVMSLMGTYADTVSPNVLMQSRSDRIPAEMARMPGVRFVTATEPQAGRSWDEQQVKAITGGDPLEVRFLHGQPFVYQPQFKLMIVGNSEPEIKNVDSAMLRRIHIVPINVPVPREKQVANLSDLMIEGEGPQILQWIIHGCVAWQSDGLPEVPAVAEVTREYAREEDLVSQWIGECCEVHPDAEASRKELFASWAQWCRTEGEDPGKAKQFRRRMRHAAKTHRLTDTQVGPARLSGYKGIRLRIETVDGTEFDA